MWSFLTLLLGYYDVDIGSEQLSLKEKNLASPNLFKEGNIVLSNNTKNLIAKILTESDEKVISSNIDFNDLAIKLQELYPHGIKPGTTHRWRSDTETIAQKLRAIVVKYNFTFTEEEAIRATREYVSSFKDVTKMQLLRNFLLLTIDKGNGQKEMQSTFMSIIENNRDEDNN